MRVYTVSFDNVSVAAIQDLVNLVAASDKPCVLLGYEITQTLRGDVGDAKEELLRIQMGRGFTANGSGGAAVTPVPFESTAEASAGFTARCNDTTIANTGTEQKLAQIAFNARIGIKEWYPPEMRPGFSAVAGNNRLCFRLMTAPNNTLTLSGTFYVGELG